MIANNKQNIFTSKSNVLKFLQNQIKNSKIEKLYVFQIEDWDKNKNKILKEINQYFINSNKVIVRSSAIGEDSLESSKAGSYESILDVNPKLNKALINAINLVLNSYEKKLNYNKKNQILIQNQSLKIIQSGVIFTRLRNGSPYYIINFEDGSSTIGVTQGKVSNLIKIFRKTDFKKIPKKWKKLLKSIQEIEKITSNTYLDIEFGITKSNEIIIFQVRPLISENDSELDNKIEKELKIIQTKYNKFIENNSNKKIILSDMADWNPSEIIGGNPNMLDYSLYDFLIMDKSWYLGREQIDYQIPSNSNLMVKFGNKPYVNTLSSFISLTPNKLPKKITSKLLKYYNQELSSHPYLHDKIEFDIVLTCFDLTFDKKLKKLMKLGFTENEVKKIRDVFILFTNQVINNFDKVSKNSKLKIEIMSKNRIEIKNKIRKNNYDISKKIEMIELLLNDCKELGAVEFSKMARMGFISTIILKSMVKTNNISKKIEDSILNSIESPLTQFQQDLMSYYKKKISKTKFLTKYGHLRPGTYDITQLRYDQDNKFLEQMQFKSNVNTVKISSNKINKILEKNGIDTSSINFIDFVKRSLEYREEFKFQFTKNLSDILELINDIGTEFNFTRNEIANLDIKTIIKSKNVSKKIIKEKWNKKIQLNKKQKKINNHLILPPLIYKKNDFNIIEYYSAHPNFITEKSINSETVVLQNDLSKKELKNKIIILENADPGYDWIFSCDPAGLITKYGGIASHMSIRCSEIGLPAVIGCGEILYGNILESSKILLDCKNNEILIIEHLSNNQFVEERKVLKSLGYIK